MSFSKSLMKNMAEIEYESSSSSSSSLKRTFDDVAMGGNHEDGKRPRYSNNSNSPSKRMSSGSTASVDSMTKKISKTVTGQLVTKNMYCVNNEGFYLFKFLVDNVPKNYYGNNNLYQTLELDNIYEIELVYENKRLAIDRITLCKNMDKTIVVKRFVEPIDFDGEDTITVGAKLKYGFKLIDTDAYKVVFIINHGKDRDSYCPVQIECMANLKRWAACIKDENITNERSLLEYFNAVQNKMFNLYRVKCQQSNGNYKNFSIQNITQISMMNDPEFNIVEDENNLCNISRSNKRVVCGQIARVNVERQSDDRFSISYQLIDERDEKDERDEWIKGSFYVKNNNNDKRNNNNNNGNSSNSDKMDKLEKMKMDKLEKLEIDLNQLNDLIDDDIYKVLIYVAVDITTNNCTVLGLTKIEIDTDHFEGV
ncbi:Late expression factor 3 lef-3 [Spodoptera exigua multiple nucleopolyhedrovirus]|nr:Late expression factor 3 lef-3 [Spodoptera exigua multiple nucleopolyhedrovirus]CDG72842.1 Late expression factor 3 lef-3 [Spodoptera exigua multiple nucleopolyhedrovirus]CDG73131.1 Late expression factor 3 lef-3 [Spodoptera exigua multiple nucleopolyhedrovirus]